MDELLITLPGYYNGIVERLTRADWLVHNFTVKETSELYNPANYIYNIEFENKEYRALLDLNVFQYIVNCVKKGSMHSLHRDACALLVFFRAAEIQIEPSLAIYERINYNGENLKEALDELSLLRALDNADVEELARYALGDKQALKNVHSVDIDRKSLGEKLTRYYRLTHWDSIYLLVLKAVATYWDSRVPTPKKLEHYLDWMIREFRMSLPCIVYATRLFGHDPLSKMMKFKMDADEHVKRTAVFNMTWDLFHIDHFFKNWADSEQEWEELFFTQDHVLRSLFRLAISVQYQEDIAPLLNYLTSSQTKVCRAIIESAGELEGRVYGTSSWSPEHREKLIRMLEKELFY